MSTTSFWFQGALSRYNCAIPCIHPPINFRLSSSPEGGGALTVLYSTIEMATNILWLYIECTSTDSGKYKVHRRQHYQSSPIDQSRSCDYRPCGSDRPCETHVCPNKTVQLPFNHPFPLTTCIGCRLRNVATSLQKLFSRCSLTARSSTSVACINTRT